MGKLFSICRKIVSFVKNNGQITKLSCFQSVVMKTKQKFGFIKRVDKGEITTVKDLES